MDTARVLAIRRISAAIAAASIFTHVGSNAGAVGATTSPPDDSGPTSSDGARAALDFGRLRDDESLETGEHVAAIPGTDIYAPFALSRFIDGGDFEGALAYFCDGQSVANWFRLVDSSAAGLTFENAAGARFSAQIDDDGTIVAVNVPIGDVTYTMLVPQVDADGEAGLYLADSAIDSDLAADERAGWIVLPDGTQRGAIRADSTVLPGTTLASGSTSVTVAGREVLLRSITHIIGLDNSP